MSCKLGSRKLPGGDTATFGQPMIDSQHVFPYFSAVQSTRAQPLGSCKYRINVYDSLPATCLRNLFPAGSRKVPGLQPHNLTCLGTLRLYLFLVLRVVLRGTHFYGYGNDSFQIRLTCACVCHKPAVSVYRSRHHRRFRPGARNLRLRLPQYTAYGRLAWVKTYNAVTVYR